MKGGRPEHITGDVAAEAVTYAVTFCGAGWSVIRHPDNARLLPHGKGWSTDGHNDAWFASLSKAAGAFMAWAMDEEAKRDD